MVIGSGEGEYCHAGTCVGFNASDATPASIVDCDFDGCMVNDGSGGGKYCSAGTCRNF
jgi:hypothetical protein